MTTTITQFTGGHTGAGGAPDDRIDTLAIGGTAAAGDWLQVTTTGGADGNGLDSNNVTDDVSGSTGWIIDFDVISGSGSDEFRTMGWRKLCVGGETTVTVTWPGAANHCCIGFWASTLTQPDLYLIDSGAASFNPPDEEFTAGAGLILSDHETYVGGMSAARGNVTNANFKTPPTPAATSGDGTVIASAVSAIAHYSTAESSNLASDTLTYLTQPVQAAYMFWYGFTTLTPPPVEMESTGGVLLGTADLSVFDAVTELASTGGLVGGTSALESTGGAAEMASSGGILTGRARLTSLAPWPPPPPVPQTRRLGCGVYDVFIFDRGLRRIIGRTPFTTLNWNRVLDDTSDATVTVDGVSNTGALRRCCQLLGSLNPWQHEIGIYRTGRRVWSGPVLTVQFPAEQVLIHALDLSGWLTVREIIHGRNDVGVDLAAIWVAYVSDAMSPENSAGLYAHPALDTGVTADRLYTEDMHTIASDAIAELARTGLDWTCIDRVMSGGPTLAQPPAFPGATPIPTLIDESFALAPTVTRDGSIMGNAWRSLGMAVPPSTTPLMGEYGPAYPATVDHIAQAAAPDYAALEAEFGRIGRVVNETKILDQASINQNAATRYDLTKRPVDVIDSGKLLPSAGITIDQLTPGSLQNLHLSRACVQIAAVYRLKSLSVTAASDGSEEVDGSWEPVGSVEAHEDLG